MATAKKPAGKVSAPVKKASAPTKAVAKSSGRLASLNEKVAQTVRYEQENRDVSGRQYNYLKIIGNSANDPITKEGKPEYIKGAKEGVWVIPSQKLLLGKAVTLSIKGMFKVYEDSIPGQKKDPKSKQEPMRQVIAYWLPQDAEQIPLEGIFERPYRGKDGVDHILKPVHWMFVYLHEHPEIEDAVITFRSTGNRIYKEVQKLIAANATTATELRFTMTHQEIAAEGWDKDYLYPLFEIDGRNYDYEDEKISLCKGGMDEDELADFIEASFKVNEDYALAKIVTRKGNIAAMIAGYTAPALEDKTGWKKGYEDDGDAKPAKF